MTSPFLGDITHVTEFSYRADNISIQIELNDNAIKLFIKSSWIFSKTGTG